VVSDLFWMHHDSIKLLNAFNIVFLMDTTYKTNKYQLPLVEIVGVTSIGLASLLGLHSYIVNDNLISFSLWKCLKDYSCLLRMVHK